MGRKFHFLLYETSAVWEFHLCLMRDSFSHLKQAMSTSDRFFKLEKDLDSLITNTETSPGVTTPLLHQGKVQRPIS